MDKTLATETDYYALPYVSNSSLTELERMLRGGTLPGNIGAIYAFGRLTDELIFEPEKADTAHPDLKRAVSMRDRVLKDPFLAWYLSLEGTEKQKVVLFERMGVRCKMKADALNVPAGMLFEFKTTAAASERQFDQMVAHFDYDRQVAFYMDGAGVGRCSLAGVGKTPPHPLFKRAIDRSHPWYVSGRAKYERLLQLCVLYGIGTD